MTDVVARASRFEAPGLAAAASPDGVASPAGLLKARLLDYALTPREAEIVWLMASGMSNKEIAARCGIALQTVKDHLKHAYAKAGAHQRTALLAKLIGTAH